MDRASGSPRAASVLQYPACRGLLDADARQSGPERVEVGGGQHACMTALARCRQSVSAPEIKMQFCKTEALAQRNSHAVPPVGVRCVLYDGIDAVSGHVALVAIGRRWRDYRNLVSFNIDTGLGQCVPQR